MFRRPFARHLRRALRPDVHPLLQRANELLASGDYPAAARAYEQLARGAQARGLPRAAQLFLQAGRSHLLAGQVPAAIADLKQGLALLADRRDFQHLNNAGQRTLADLAQRGLAAEAAELQAWLQGLLPASFAAASVASPARKALLPTACPSCGAPLRSDEVEWADESTAECPFCGASIRAQA